MLVQASFVKKSIFSSLNSLGTFAEYQSAIKLRFYYWSLNSNLLIHMSLLMSVSHILNCCSSAVSFEIEKVSPPPLFLLKIILSTLGYLHSYRNFRINFSISARKKAPRVLKGIVLILQINLGKLPFYY